MGTPPPLSAAQLALLVPGISAEAVRADPAAALLDVRSQRSSVFDDETLLFYLAVRLPAGTSEEAARDAFALLELQVDTSIMDASTSSSSSASASSLSARQHAADAVLRSSSSSPPSSARPYGSGSSSHPRQTSMPSKLQRGGGWSIGGGVTTATPSRVSRTDADAAGVAAQAGCSYAYDRGDQSTPPTVFQAEGCWCCLFPLSATVANFNLVRRQAPTLLISVSVTQLSVSLKPAGAEEDDADWCDPEKIDSVNLLGGLADGMSAAGGLCTLKNSGGSVPVYKMPSTPQQGAAVVPATPAAATAPARRFARKSLPVCSALAVAARTSPVSPGNDILSISISANAGLQDELEFSMRHIEVDVTDAVVSPCAPLSVGADNEIAKIRNADEMSILYSVILDDPTTGARGDEPDMVGGALMPPGGPGSQNALASSLAPSGWLFADHRRPIVSVTIHGEVSRADLAPREVRSRWYFHFWTLADAAAAAAGGQARSNAFGGPRALEPASGDFSQRAARLGRTEQGNPVPSARHSRGKRPSESRQHHKIASKDRPGPAGIKSIIGKLSRQKGGGGGGSGGTASRAPAVPQSPAGGSASSLAPRPPSRLFSGGRSSPVRTSLHSVYESRSADKQAGPRETLVVSFSVAGETTVRQIFTLRVFIVNRTDRTRMLTIMIPNRRKVPVPLVPAAGAPNQAARQGNLMSADLPPLPADRRLDLCMENAVFLKRHLENEKKEASVVCLENNVRLTPLQPYSCQSTSLHFIPIKEHLHRIDLIQLLDNDTGTVVNMRDVLEIYVKGADECA